MDRVLQAPKLPPQSAADAETEKNLRETFKKISGVDLEVDAYELRDILNSAFMKGTGKVCLGGSHGNLPPGYTCRLRAGLARDRDQLRTLRLYGEWDFLVKLRIAK